VAFYLSAQSTQGDFSMNKILVFVLATSAVYAPANACTVEAVSLASSILNRATIGAQTGIYAESDVAVANSHLQAMRACLSDNQKKDKESALEKKLDISYGKYLVGLGTLQSLIDAHNELVAAKLQQK
jgi:hypothetical protein